MSDEITVSATGTVTKAVVCAGCQGAYFYRMTRKTSATRGTGFNSAKAENKAREAAEQRLRERLENEVDPVPCPVCGEYQPDMLDGIRRHKFRWYRRATITLFVFAWIFLAATGVCSVNDKDKDYAAGVPLFGGLTAFFYVASFVGLMVYKAKKKGYDPNSEPVEDRLVIGRHRAVTADSLNKMFEQMDASPDQPPQVEGPKPWQKGGGS